MAERRYVRNRDIKKLKASDVPKDSRGVILTRYLGTVANARKRGVPLYNMKGICTHKFGKPFG